MHESAQLGISSEWEAQSVVRKPRLPCKLVILGLICARGIVAAAQQDSQTRQDIPDAPSASQPPQNFPKAAPNPKPGTVPENRPPENEPIPDSQPQPPSDSESGGAPPSPKITSSP